MFFGPTGLGRTEEKLLEVNSSINAFYGHITGLVSNYLQGWNLDPSFPEEDTHSQREELPIGGHPERGRF